MDEAAQSAKLDHFLFSRDARLSFFTFKAAVREPDLTRCLGGRWLHAVFASWFCVFTEEIRLSAVQNGQAHAADRGRCATHCRCGETKGSLFILFEVRIYFVDFLLTGLLFYSLSSVSL